MTELKKALECCKSGDCANCPLNSKAYNNECKNILFEEVIAEIDGANELVSVAIDVQNNFHEKIEEQEAEIERLNIRNQTLSAITKNYDWKFSKARAEAIKEVYTRLSMNFGTYTDDDSVKLVDLFRLIDNLLKEMGCGE